MARFVFVSFVSAFVAFTAFAAENKDNVSTESIYDVIVVGCGPSGVAALRKLYDAGINAVGLEASDRIGGRIHTVDFGAGKVDLGAEWCDNISNPVLDLAKPFNLVELEPSKSKWYFLSNGDLVSNNDIEDMFLALKNAVDAADKTGTNSVSDVIRNTAKTNEVFKKDPNLGNWFVEWYERKFQLGHNGNPHEAKSLKGIAEVFGRSMNWKGRGYKTLLEILLNKYPDPSSELPIQIHLNKEVETIVWNSEETRTTVQIKCTNNEIYTARSVIVTPSVSVLRERPNFFSPPLPVDKMAVIKKLQLLVLGKIFIEFTKPWWPKQLASFGIIWRAEDKAKFTEEERWITEIYTLDTVAYQPNLLIAWTYGNGAVEMEKSTEENVFAGINKLLNVVINKQFNASAVKNIIRSQWATNPLTRGSSMYRTVDFEKSVASTTALKQPLLVEGFPIVCFGGEATSHLLHGSVQGAVESGYREADRLISSFNNLEKNTVKHDT